MVPMKTTGVGRRILPKTPGGFPTSKKWFHGSRWQCGILEFLYITIITSGWDWGVPGRSTILSASLLLVLHVSWILSPSTSV